MSNNCTLLWRRSRQWRGVCNWVSQSLPWGGAMNIALVQCCFLLFFCRYTDLPQMMRFVSRQWRFTDYLVCLFWPQVLTPSRSSSRSWWINVCKYLFWLEIYCLLSLNYHLDLHRLSTHMVCLTRRKKGIEADGCCSRDCCWCCR